MHYTLPTFNSLEEFKQALDQDEKIYLDRTPHDDGFMLAGVEEVGGPNSGVEWWVKPAWKVKVQIRCDKVIALYNEGPIGIYTCYMERLTFRVLAKNAGDHGSFGSFPAKTRDR